MGVPWAAVQLSHLSRSQAARHQCLHSCIKSAPSMDLVCTWYATGMNLVWTWYEPGMRLVQGWYAPGLNMVCTWYGSDLQLACTWYAPGLDIVCTWYAPLAPGMHLVCTWHTPGMHLVCTWYAPGMHLAHTWHAPGMHTARNRYGPIAGHGQSSARACTARHLLCSDKLQTTSKASQVLQAFSSVLCVIRTCNVSTQQGTQLCCLQMWRQAYLDMPLVLQL